MSGLFLLAVLPSYADEARVRDIDIEATVRDDGAIDIVERWDVTVTSGTEWYLVRNNLGDIAIEDFSVNDDVQGPLRNIGKWDVDASRQRKAGKCGGQRGRETQEQRPAGKRCKMGLPLCRELGQCALRSQRNDIQGTPRGQSGDILSSQGSGRRGTGISAQNG